jgi:Ca2+-binding RTX toxin-like protein
MAAENIFGGPEDNIYIVDDVGDLIQDQGGNDTIQTALTIYSLPMPMSVWAGGITMIQYDNQIENLTYVGPRNFTGFGNYLNNVITGDGGNDTLNGNMGDDILNGGDGSDSLTGAMGNDTLNGGDGNDTLTGDAGSDSLVGGAGDDTLIAGTVESRSYSDGTVERYYTEITTEIDTLDGGTGNDIYIIGSNDIVIEQANGGIDTVVLNSEYLYSPVNPDPIHTYTLGANVENLMLRDADQRHVLIGNDLDNVIKIDHWNSWESWDRGHTLDGGAGNDTLIAGHGFDDIIGGEGIDTAVLVGNYADYTVNRDGDQLTLGHFDDLVDGYKTLTGIEKVQFADRLVDASELQETPTEEPYPDVSYGARPLTNSAKEGETLTFEISREGTDLTEATISYFFDGTATPGKDHTGTNGSVTFAAGETSKTITVNVLTDEWHEDTENVWLVTDNGLFAAVGIINVDAPPSVDSNPLPPVTPPTPEQTYAGNNSLTGTGGADHLKGYGGNDVLKSGAGNDYLYGGLGNDKLYGQSGKDSFVFDTKPNKSTNKDAIMDFSVKDDTIRLENAIFTKLGSKTGTLKSGAFWSNNTGKAHDKDDWIIYDKDSGVLYYDADGSGKGAAVAFTTLSKNLEMTNKDFYVI